MVCGARPATFLETVLRRDRLIVAIALFMVVALAWAYLLTGAGMDEATPGMADMPGMVMAAPAWTLHYALLMFAMWWIMMLPSATPTILLLAAINHARQGAAPYGKVGFFVAGYLLMWALFSVAAALAQGMLDAAGLLSAAMATACAPIAGALLFGAGLWQFAPLKQMCLRHCRSPVMFLTEHRRAGNWQPVYGRPARGLLCGLLRVPDGAAVRGRGDESVLDTGPEWLCAGRKTASLGGTHRRPGGWVALPVGSGADAGPFAVIATGRSWPAIRLADRGAFGGSRLARANEHPRASER